MSHSKSAHPRAHTEAYSHLDERQREAVCSEIQPIWVNAGPGAGKTRVIVERIKYLILHKNISINTIIALTFTNKAANEMQERVMHLLHTNSNHSQPRLKCETFHAFCLKILKQYGSLIGIDPKFEILTDPKRMIKPILKRQSILQFIENTNIDSRKIQIPKIIQIIARAKTQLHQNANEFEHGVQRKENIEQCNHSNTNNNGYRNYDEYTIRLYELTAKIYHEYEQELRSQNKLDFNDLLFKTMELFQSNKETKALDNIVRNNQYSHVVIDEFQDTNSIQFLIAKALVLHRYKMYGDFKSIMVVGDNDQTIFSWRGSQNFHSKFKNTFKNYKEIQLQHNYRSTKNILNVANCIINQSHDEDRKDKKMITNAKCGDKVWFEACKSDQDEAYFIIAKLSEIYQEFHRTHPNQPFNLSNTAILYRSTVQTRVIEEKLNQSMLKYVVAGGVSFYQRTEIVELTTFLKMLNNPKDDQSVIYIMKSSLKLFSGIGPQTIAKLQQFGETKQLSLQATLFKIKSIDKISDKIRTQIITFLKLIMRLRKMKDNPSRSVSDLLEHVLKEIDYHDHIHTVIKNKNQAEERWQNVEELVKIANEFDEQYAIEHGDTDSDDDEEIKIIENDADKLSDFLHHIALTQPSSDDAELDSSRSNHPICNLTGRIQLSTIHKAKGLEWNNVFVIGCSHGQLPHYRAIMANDIEEERRLAFVAVTRAQQRLFLSYALWRNDHQQNNETNTIRSSKTMMSEFFKHCPLESIVYHGVSYNDNNKKRKKVRKNVFKKSKKRKRKQMEEPIQNGFEKANQFGFNAEDKGRKVREERAKMVEKLGTGFQKASTLKHVAKNKNEMKTKKKRKFKVPRMIQKTNGNECRQEVEKENCDYLKYEYEHVENTELNESKKEDRIERIKTKKKKGTKRVLDEMQIDDDQSKKKKSKPPKKKRKKNKRKLEQGQKLISSFFGKK